MDYFVQKTSITNLPLSSHGAHRNDMIMAPPKSEVSMNILLSDSHPTRSGGYLREIANDTNGNLPLIYKHKLSFELPIMSKVMLARSVRLLANDVV